MGLPWWLQGMWLMTGVCLAWIVGAVGTWVGRAGGPLVGGVAVVVAAWGFSYWSAGRAGRVLGSLLQAAASGGAAAALVMIWFSPLLEAWRGSAWLPAAGWRLTLAALSGVTLGAAIGNRAGDPELPFPDAAALAEVIGWPGNGRRWRILLAAAALAAAARAGVAAGWWPGAVVAAGDGRGWAGLLGLAVAPGLLGVGLAVGWDKAAALAAGSLAVGAVVFPGALEFRALKAIAPALQAAGETAGLELQASYAPLIGLGAAVVAVAFALGRRVWVAWKARRSGLWPAGGSPARSAAPLALLAVLLGTLAIWRLWEAGVLPETGVPLLLATGALIAALGVAAAAYLGSLALPALGFPALALAASALGAGRTPGTLLTAGALGSAAALFAADYLQARRVNLLLEVKWPLYLVKLASCLAGLGGAALAASTLAAAPVWVSPPGAGVVSRVALAGLAGRLPAGLMVSGAGVGVLSALLARPVWLVALGVLLPLPSALTLLLGGAIHRRPAERARVVGLGLLLGDLLAQGATLFLQAWNALPLGWGRWTDTAAVATGWKGRLAGLLALTALVACSFVLVRSSHSAPGGAGRDKLETAAGNAAAAG